MLTTVIFNLTIKDNKKHNGDFQDSKLLRGAGIRYFAGGIYL
jgi:hypothetical protein